MHYLRSKFSYQGHRIRPDPYNRMVNPQVSIPLLSHSFFGVNHPRDLALKGFVRLKFRLQSGGKGNQVVTYCAGFCYGILKRDVGNFCAAKHNKAAELTLVHQINSS